jgi:aminodeoxyfutalosine deaminase
MTGPPLASGGVLVDGERIAAVGDAGELRRHAARTQYLEGAVLLPGFVNAHTHLEYAAAAPLARPGPFLSWMQALAGFTADWGEEQWTRSAHHGVLQALRSGVTTVGDVVSRGPAVPACTRAGLAGDSWVEVAGVDFAHHDRVLADVDHALRLPAGQRGVGVAPQAPSSVGTGVLQALAALVARTGSPLHVHAAESQAEVAAIRGGEGPCAELWRSRGLSFEWLDGGTGLTPVRYLDACGALGPGTTLAHAVWVDREEAQLLAERAVGVVCCARSNELLNVGAAPLERYAEAGTPLAVGTESAASCPDQDILAEAAAWVRLARARDLTFWPSQVGPIALEEAAIRLITAEGARAMGWGDRSGLLEEGRRADIVAVAVPATPETVYRELIEQGAGRQVLTVVGGVRKARRDDPDAPWQEVER